MAESKPYGYSSKTDPKQLGTKTDTSESIASSYLSAYDYGTSTEKLDAATAIRNIAKTGGSVYSGATSRASGSTGSQSITGVGFKPSRVEIMATIGGTGAIAQSTGIGDMSGVNTIYWANNGGTMSGGIVGTNIVQLVVSSLGAQAQLSSLDSDGFTLGWSFINSGVSFVFKCYP